MPEVEHRKRHLPTYCKKKLWWRNFFRDCTLPNCQPAFSPYSNQFNTEFDLWRSLLYSILLHLDSAVSKSSPFKSCRRGNGKRSKSSRQRSFCEFTSPIEQERTFSHFTLSPEEKWNQLYFLGTHDHESTSNTQFLPFTHFPCFSSNDNFRFISSFAALCWSLSLVWV
jgi:hypothetical protein